MTSVRRSHFRRGPEVDTALPDEPFELRRQSGASTHGFRVDLQLLRALAIALVLLHHARVPLVPGGFLGVDIFFVVSGFLMTGIISRELDEGKFRFRDFFARRARRILPASFSTLTVTTVGAFLLLDFNGYRHYLAQLAGSLSFGANLVLWRQSDYFAADSALMPLLHMWSLSVEEQFYLIVPVLLWLLPPRLRIKTCLLLTLGSLVLCLALKQVNPSAVFYLLPFRAWELGTGAAMALAIRARGIGRRQMWPLRLLLLAVLLALPLVATEAAHPGLAAIVACAATAMLMVPGGDLRMTPLLRPLVALGNRSYSLYLVHWPIYSFANNIFIEEVPAWVNALLLLPILLCTELQYRFVEQPFRKAHIGRREVALYVLGAMLLVGTALAAAGRLPRAFVTDGRPNVGLGADCPAIAGLERTPFPCHTAVSPSTLLWGDSFAMALAPGLVHTTPGGLAQATQSMCGPFLGIAPYDGGKRSSLWAEACIRRNDEVLAALQRSPSIDTVVITSAMAQYVPGMGEGMDTMVRTSAGLRRHHATDAILISAVQRTVAAARAAGKRVVFVAPPPAPGYDVGRCATRSQQGKPTIIPAEGCSFGVGTYRTFRAPMLRVLALIEQRAIVPVVWLDRVICPGGRRCSVVRDSTLLYRDEGHLTGPGARWLGTATKLGTWARSVAR